MQLLLALCSVLATSPEYLTVCYDMNSNFEVLSDELDIGVRSGLVDASFSTEYSKLLKSMAERVEDTCLRYRQSLNETEKK